MHTRSPLPNLNLTRVTRRYGRRLEETLGSRTPFLFLIGVLAVGLMTEGLSKLIDAYLTQTSHHPGIWTFGIGVLALAGGIVFYSLPQRVWMVLADNRFLHILPSTASAHGLIVLASQGTRPCPAEAAIQSHQRQSASQPQANSLRTCWILADNDFAHPHSAANNALRIKETHETAALQILIVNLPDADNPSDTFLATKQILHEIRQRRDLNEAETVADFTGGNKVMSAGLIAACSQTGVHLAYMQAKHKDEDGQPIYDEQAMPHIVRLEGEMTLSEQNALP